MSIKINRLRKSAIKSGTLSATFMILLLVMVMGGCANMAQTGAVVGGLTGALIGGHFGPDAGVRGTNALIGAGIGAGFGYMVGNEMDKAGYRPNPYYDNRDNQHQSFYHEGTHYVYDPRNGYYVAVP